jgi:hypothetical protein
MNNYTVTFTGTSTATVAVFHCAGKLVDSKNQGTVLYDFSAGFDFYFADKTFTGPQNYQIAQQIAQIIVLMRAGLA